MKRALTLVGLFTLSACVTVAPEDVASRPIVLSAAQNAVIEGAIKNVLKDPDSAKFGDRRAGASSKGTITVCGYVNSKNSFGGYVGMQPFIGEFPGDGDIFKLTALASSQVPEDVILTTCRQFGVPL